jgi:hypothetical protein
VFSIIDPIFPFVESGLNSLFAPTAGSSAASDSSTRFKEGELKPTWTGSGVLTALGEDKPSNPVFCIDFHLALSFSHPPIDDVLLLGRTAWVDSGLRDANPRKLD